MGNIGNQLRLHPLALYFLIHRFSEPFLDLIQFLLIRLKHSKILVKSRVQVPLRNRPCGVQKLLVLIL